jgi:acetylornithine deacetylase/succinyl-diaminopimelate desuccinylase-like protein
MPLAGLVELTADLVAIDSVNSSLVHGGAGEADIAAFVAGWTRDAGLEVDVLEGTPGRPNVIVRARGTGGGSTLLLCGHLDTVSVEGMTEPHRPRIEGDRMFGRGSYDMKAGLPPLSSRAGRPRISTSRATSSSRPWPTRSTPAQASRRCCEASARTRPS